MAYDYSHLKRHIENTEEWLQQEYRAIRTGEASPALLDGVKVEAYGTQMPVNQLANLTREDARTLRLSPYDASQLGTIEKAINDADLGVSVIVDGSGARIVFPELTSERRQRLQKVTNEKLEQARVALRNERDKTQKDIEAKEKAGELSEDEKFRAKEEMQKLIDAANRKLEETAKRKEEELAR